ncbi:hypothetical protein BDD43_3426 [Mucilaginibacter gracilis]|uniref:Uncharacterized protein n=1 Tax=Mucilaginibacter gracilis TaxID=423350 RepID=A0A495J317_9SPHI|nr:hypothetical protein [Mucilaginibacter gracilis]RKR83223.1 hypothetical protein BDD43_3426 [Mucilaginibacter gracilis]
MEIHLIDALRAHEELCMISLIPFVDKEPTNEAKMIYKEMIEAQNERKLLQSQIVKN